MEVRWQVEIDPFCCEVLEKHWPGVKRYGDIKQLTGTELEPVDLICGGFPCQDLSRAGFMRGIAGGDRSVLWSDFARLVGVLRPRFVLIENVPGLLANEPMRRVLGDLSALGFDAEWESLPAAFVGAPHIRDRVWIFAYPRQEFGVDARGHYDRGRRDYVFQKADDRVSAKRGTDWELVALAPGVHQRSSADWWLRQSGVARSVNGIPRELVDTMNGAFGNAVVPQVAEWIGRKILNVDAMHPVD
jgi:DNA (cytosine-5)-methyltransferase 1